MAVTYNKPKGLRYVDMCIYIDKYMPYVVEEGKYPEIESKIYEYIYHIVYALSYKKYLFQNFADYDAFSLYVASNLYINMRNRYQHAGEIRRGKEVKPVKSVLNYIKAILFPMKIAYQNQFFQSEFDPGVGQDTSKISYDLKESVRNSYNEDLQPYYEDALLKLPKLIKWVVKTTPYGNDKLTCKRLYLSCYLSLIDQVTFPNKIKKKYEKKLQNNKDGDRGEENITDYYYSNFIDSSNIILWHLDESFRDYVHIMVRRIKETFSNNLLEDYHKNDINENVIDSILNSAFEANVIKSDKEVY